MVSFRETFYRTQKAAVIRRMTFRYKFVVFFFMKINDGRVAKGSSVGVVRFRNGKKNKFKKKRTDKAGRSARGDRRASRQCSSQIFATSPKTSAVGFLFNFFFFSRPTTFVVTLQLAHVSCRVVSFHEANVTRAIVSSSLSYTKHHTGGCAQ